MSKSLEEQIEELSKELEELKFKLDKEKSNNCKRWKAGYGETYYYICSDGSIYHNTERNGEFSTSNYDLGNYFQTKGEAKKTFEKIKIYTQLKDLALRLNKGEKIDWTNNNQAKYYIYYNRGTMKLDYNNDWSYQRIGQIYCLDIYFLDIAEQEIGEENLKKLFE